MKRGFVAKLGGSITVAKVSDDKYKFTTVNGPKTKERVVTFGQEFEEDGMDGGKVKVCICIFMITKIFYFLF